MNSQPLFHEYYDNEGDVIMEGKRNQIWPIVLSFSHTKSLDKNYQKVYIPLMKPDFTGARFIYFSGVCEIMRPSQAPFWGYFTPSVKLNFTDAQKVTEFREVSLIFRASVKSDFTADVLNAPI
jgi:hypothetical protein